MEADSRDLLTVEQAANYLQLSQSSIRSYIRQGRLKAFRVAGKRKVLIPRQALMDLLEPARGDEEDGENGGKANGGTGSGNSGGSIIPPARS
jgi:excisionase family DNA binding protein